MAQVYNIPARAQRNSETGLVWEEKLSGATGTVEVAKYSSIRVRAAGATVVTIGGVKAATMMTDEIMVFNAGIGNSTDTKKTVSVVISVAGAYVQVGRMVEVPSQEG